MGINIEVELCEFDEGDIVEYLQDLGYTVSKEEQVQKNVVEFTSTDVFNFKAMSKECREQVILDKVLTQLGLEYLL